MEQETRDREDAMLGDGQTDFQYCTSISDEARHFIVSPREGSELNNLDNDKLCECDVPIMEAHNGAEVESLLAQIRSGNLLGSRGKAKKRIGRPKKIQVLSHKVSDSNLELLNTLMSLELGAPKIAERVWEMGKELGVSLSGNDQQMISISQGMEVRDREAIGKGGMDTN
ncbi:hypothetical protein SESBI_05851 [Sesbania bispinosa]|nr:hypothetical protein SESBI_05851 [Sesbania bispinosa]